MEITAKNINPGHVISDGSWGDYVVKEVDIFNDRDVVVTAYQGKSKRQWFWDVDDIRYVS